MSTNVKKVEAPFYQTQDFADQSLRLLEIRGTHSGCSWHFHPENQIGFVIEGRGQRVVGDSVSPIRKGEIVLLGANLPHVWRYNESATSEDQVHAVVVHFRDDFLGEEFLRKPELRDVRLLLARATLGLQVHGKTRRRVSKIIFSMLEDDGFQRVLDLLELLDVLAHSSELEELCSAGFQPLSTNLDVARLRRVCDYIQSNFGNHIDRDSAAALAHLSPSAFSRFFKAHTGKTFQEFVADVRIGHSCRMLMDAGNNISTVALQCGFSDVSSFNRSFRRIKGMAPSAFRHRVGAVTNGSDRKME